MRGYVLERSDGGVALLWAPHEIDPNVEAQKWQQCSGGISVVSIRSISIDDLPRDNFRDAWKADLSVDMEKARTIHMNRIRGARNRELQKADIEFMKALETGESLAVEKAITRKKTLRDIPNTFDLSSAQTPDELSHLWPVDLPRE